jgi:peptidoglycan/LPS O-acetylase OafA/YrhL
MSEQRKSKAPPAQTGILRPYMPELETVRGIACLSVLFLHAFAWQYSGRLQFSRIPQLILKITQPGNLGVNLFFVLSGFLITGILLDSKNNTAYYKPFYIRRALRILPPCYALLLVLFLFAQTRFSFVLAGFFYLANLTSFLGIPMAYGPLWSLAVEEHYYLVWPLAVRNLSSKFLFWIAVGLVVVSPLLRGTAFYLGHPTGIDWYTWYVSDGLAAGSILAIVLRGSFTRRNARVLCALLILFSLCTALIGAPYGILTRQRILGAAFQFTLIHMFFAGFLLLVLLLGSSRYARWVNNRVLGFFGYISYGLYLYHFLIFRWYDKACAHYFPQLQPVDWRFDLVLLRFLIGGGIATGVAYLSRRYYEEAFLRLKKKFTPQKQKQNLPADPLVPAVAAVE